MTLKLTLLLGDRNGIGPEILARSLISGLTDSGVQLEIMGDRTVLEEGARAADVTLDHNQFDFVDFHPLPEITTTPGQATQASGQEMLANLSQAAKRVEQGLSSGVVFAPLNKEAMHLGGLTLEDEMQYLRQELAFDGPCGELNVLDKLDSLWTTRVTSHVPLKDVAQHITPQAISRSIAHAHDTLVAAGFKTPRIGVAALNPHAGDGGNFGREEIDIIEPAVAKARAGGLNVEGPLPSDTIFVRARNNQFDVVVTMYHDQGQIAMKLMGFGRGVTVLGGLPVPVTTCGHGTGYDIVGKGIAKIESFKNAFEICRNMAASRLATMQGGATS